MNLLKTIVRKVRGGSGSTILKPSERAQRLARILDGELRLGPDIEARIDAISSEMMSHSEPHHSVRYATVADHFAGASSTKPKLARWEALVRELKPASILELGTAYGLSAITMAKAQDRPKLTTIEFSEPQATIGRQNIEKSIGAGVECVKGDKNLILPELRQAGRRFDYVFHDGGHAGDDYVKDFESILPMLEPGSTYIVDDISWDDKPEIRKHTSASRRTCYEGWLEIAGHERVDGALEYGKAGILLLK